MSPKQSSQGNFVSEWFGHRMYPSVVSNPSSISDQQGHRCPFLSESTGAKTICIKTESSKGVCSINSPSNGLRQDWVVCPYRAFDLELMQAITTRLYRSPAPFHIFAAPSLSDNKRQAELISCLDRKERVLIYFDQKLGGEISVSSTDKSPEIAFDTTFVELSKSGSGFGLGQYAIMEIQTMDFHGSYRTAVENLKAALRLHGNKFAEQVGSNPKWLSERIEGPNIANVFKRTFWQMMFKFEMAASPGCAGVALSIPEAVWDSWQRFLGAPVLRASKDGTFALGKENTPDDELSSWIYIFDFDWTLAKTPSPMRIKKIIRTNASAVAHHALEESPRGAIEQLRTGIYPALKSRLQRFWPLDLEIPGVETRSSGVSIVEDSRPVEEIIKEPD
jgi:hypothetical protein